MAEYRLFRGWSKKELEKKLSLLPLRDRNFNNPIPQMTTEEGWNQYASETVIAKGLASKSGGLFERACTAISNYEFSDPQIVTAHFNSRSPLRNRPMVLQMRAFKIFYYLAGVVVGNVYSEQKSDQNIFGFRYDTLEGHIERGVERFLLINDYKTGNLSFRIEAHWKPGQFPNWWSRLGFSFAGPYYQKLWHNQAHLRMTKILRNYRSSVGNPST